MGALNGNTEIFLRDTKGSPPYVHIVTIREAARLMGNEGSMVWNPRFQVYTPDGWKKCFPRLVPTEIMCRVYFENNAYIEMRKNSRHLCNNHEDRIVDVKLEDMQVGMRCPCEDPGHYAEACAEDGDNFSSRLTCVPITAVSYTMGTTNDYFLYCIELIDGPSMFLLANGMYVKTGCI